MLSLLTPSTTVAHEKQSLDMHTAIQTPVCYSMSDTSKASCRVSKALGLIFIYSSFVSISLCTVTYWSIKKKKGRVRPCPFFCSSSDSEQLCFIVMQCKCVLHLWWCRPGRKTAIFEAIGNNSLNWMLFLDTGRVFFPLHKQVCGFEGSCSSLCGKCLKTNHKKLEQNQLLPQL